MNNLDLMRKRLMWQGGIEQENRMIHDKFRTLQRALMFSYQACTVGLVQPYSLVGDLTDAEFTRSEPDHRALINPHKVSQDYDDKIISIPYECGFEPGDVFEWRKTDTQWIIYTQEITEDAYFRGEIRRCRYKIKFKDEEGEWFTYAAIRGPVETQIDSIQKNQIRVDRPNLSLNILMPKNEKTLKAFDRYSEFLFEGKCWRVNTTDSISMKNILEITAEEYFIDKDTDDTEEELKDGLVIEPVDPTPKSKIEGSTWIKPNIKENYKAPEVGGTWCVSENLPVCLKAIDAQTVSLMWKEMTSGQFTLTWSKDGQTFDKTIVVESLF